MPLIEGPYVLPTLEVSEGRSPLARQDKTKVKHPLLREKKKLIEKMVYRISIFLQNVQSFLQAKDHPLYR